MQGRALLALKPSSGGGGGRADGSTKESRAAARRAREARKAREAAAAEAEAAAAEAAAAARRPLEDVAAALQAGGSKSKRAKGGGVPPVLSCDSPTPVGGGPLLFRLASRAGWPGSGGTETCPRGAHFIPGDVSQADLCSAASLVVELPPHALVLSHGLVNAVAAELALRAAAAGAPGPRPPPAELLRAWRTAWELPCGAAMLTYAASVGEGAARGPTGACLAPLRPARETGRAELEALALVAAAPGDEAAAGGAEGEPLDARRLVVPLGSAALKLGGSLIWSPEAVWAAPVPDLGAAVAALRNSLVVTAQAGEAGARAGEGAVCRVNAAQAAPLPLGGLPPSAEALASAPVQPAGAAAAAAAAALNALRLPASAVAAVRAWGELLGEPEPHWAVLRALRAWSTTTRA